MLSLQRRNDSLRGSDCQPRPKRSWVRRRTLASLAEEHWTRGHCLVLSLCPTRSCGVPPGKPLHLSLPSDSNSVSSVEPFLAARQHRSLSATAWLVYVSPFQGAFCTPAPAAPPLPTDPEGLSFRYPAASLSRTPHIQPSVH